MKSKVEFLLPDSFHSLIVRTEITSEIVVYRFSTAKLVEYLRVKVARIATPKSLECSKTLIRDLAKQGLFEDGKEDLLQRTFAIILALKGLS